MDDQPSLTRFFHSAKILLVGKYKALGHVINLNIISFFRLCHLLVPFHFVKSLYIWLWFFFWGCEHLAIWLDLPSSIDISALYSSVNLIMINIIRAAYLCFSWMLDFLVLPNRSCSARWCSKRQKYHWYELYIDCYYVYQIVMCLLIK